jgi:hypothetical protein
MMGRALKWCIARHHWLLTGLAIVALLFNAQLYIKLTEAGNYARYCDKTRKFFFENDEYVKKATGFGPIILGTHK